MTVKLIQSKRRFPNRPLLHLTLLNNYSALQSALGIIDTADLHNLLTGNRLEEHVGEQE